MLRPWLVATLFLACLAVLLAAMGWLTVTVLRLDRAEETARRQSELQENLRLALWRMDSQLAPLATQESARPHFAYSDFYPVSNTYDAANGIVQKEALLIPSPLLEDTGNAYVLLHFQFDPNGKLTSPQVNHRANLKDDRFKQKYADELAKFSRAASRETFLKTPPSQPIFADIPQSFSPRGNDRNALEAQAQLSQNEFASRQILQQKSSSNFNKTTAASPARERIVEGAFKPRWVGDTLLLVRQVSINDNVLIQGCVLDWPSIRADLLNGIRDLLPHAELQPTGVSEPASPNTMAALPIKLLYQESPPDNISSLSPLRAALWFAWACAALAAIAVGVLLFGVLALSERRAAFVSAVTHELRTPLTTFRLYTQMLSDGMVASEEKRAEYVNTLRVESDRLAHLVENVLAYSRIERGRGGGRRASVTARELLERVRQRLADRATQAGKVLEVNTGSMPENLVLNTDISAVEQILFNLVDNACKYSANATDERIQLHVETQNGKALLRFRDFGPGIGKQQLRRLFQPFSKSASEAAVTAPGVGLGLSLSRRLAREMGGDLKIDSSVKDGAAFVLMLPRAI
jgi:signal transduction histidine kinase